MNLLCYAAPALPRLNCNSLYCIQLKKYRRIHFGISIQTGGNSDDRIPDFSFIIRYNKDIEIVHKTFYFLVTTQTDNFVKHRFN
jgi:hypothetical protein